ncbi:hypothetical protein [Amycolatopsis thermoflava]|uniref:hypothetical protein n=1 Tax=Amycolatopsis thermoflava TaxID=84480 RepID=UPI003F4A0E98
MGVQTYTLQRGRRDFAPAGALQPSRFEVVADAEVARDAVSLLRERGITDGETRR